MGESNSTSHYLKCPQRPHGGEEIIKQCIIGEKLKTIQFFSWNGVKKINFGPTTLYCVNVADENYFLSENQNHKYFNLCLHKNDKNILHLASEETKNFKY